MATNRRLERKPLNEADIEAIINKGGKPVTEVQQARNPSKPKGITIKINQDYIDRILILRERRPRKPASPKLGISLHDWILEAIEEKMKREFEAK